MITNSTVLVRKLFTFFILTATLILGKSAGAQQLQIKNFAVFGGSPTCPSPIQTAPLPPGCGVQFGSSTMVEGGHVGSYRLIRTTGSSYFSHSLHSGGAIELANANTILGNITAANKDSLTGNVLATGSNASVSGNINVYGNILISGGSVLGSVTHPEGTTYNGPTPVGGLFEAQPVLPTLPVLPGVTSFGNYGTADITNNQTITPAQSPFRDMALTGKKTLTFSGPGTYIFRSIHNTGNTNKFVFDFQNNPTGIFRIYVHGDVDLYKLNVELRNGGSASRIYMEVHGNGSTSPDGTFAWSITNGASTDNQSVWYGTVWAPYAGIQVGSGSSSSKIIGALWSGTQVNIQSGASVTFAQLEGCENTTANAGPDKNLDCNISSVQLSGSTTSSNVQYYWTALNGGIITSGENTLTPTVSAVGTYVLHVNSPGCGDGATDTAVVTFIPCIVPLNPPVEDGKTNTKIGSELTALYENSGNILTVSDSVMVVENGYVMIDVIAYQGYYTQLKNLLLTPTYGLTDTVTNGPNSLIITGMYPIANLLLLNDLTLMVNYVRPFYIPLGNNGLTQSQGDHAMGTDLVRNGYGLDGDSVKIGVISDSYNTKSGNPALTDVQNGDLPGTGNPDGNTTPVHVLKDFPVVRTDEGRAMLQIIHDAAPKAKLAFRTGFFSAGDFAQGITDLFLDTCDLIVDDVTYITEPFFKDGVVANSVNYVKSQGVGYFTAAGNFGIRSYEHLFNPGTPPSTLSGSAHDFGGGDVYQKLMLKPGVYTIVMQWEDNIYSLGETTSGGTQNDLDIYLTDNNGNILFGFNRNNLGGDPIEILSYYVENTVDSVAANLVVIRASGTSPNLRFKYVIFRGEGRITEHQSGNSTITGQGNAEGAITVGAVLYTNSVPYGGTPSIASFSSNGGTPVYNVVRNKPDISAPNGVNTTVQMGLDYEPDGYSNFFGTSAAAPHAAAAAALLIQGKKKFTNQDLGPDALKSLLQLTAMDMGPVGFDFASGFGFVQPDSAMRTFAAPTPAAYSLEFDTTITPGTVPLTVTVEGQYFTHQSQIYFRGDPLQTTVLNNTTATAIIPDFIGNPAIQVYTPPISTSGIDGGLSNSLYFFSPIKKNITVIADYKTKKYGESLPTFTSTILVDGDSLQNTSYTIQQLGLDNISYLCPATNLSNIGNYLIRPSRTFSDTSETDIGLLEQFNYTFRDSVLKIEPLPVTVTPNDTSLVYGQALGDFTFSYTFDSTLNIGDPAALFNTISNSHDSVMATNVIGLVNGQAVTIINGQAVPIINGQAVTIINGQAVTIINGQAVPIINAQSIEIVNGQAVPIINNLTEDEVDDLNLLVSQQALSGARTLQNQTLVNGSYVLDSTKVVDITQESILKYNTDSSQTTLTSSVSFVNARGMVNSAPLLNGQAVTIINGQAVPIINGQAVTIINGQAVTIINGQAVTIINGQAVTIINGQAVPIINTLMDGNKNTGVIIDQNDINGGTGPGVLKSINLVTGLGVGLQYIVPAALLDNNLEPSYNVGKLTITPAPLTIKAKDTAKQYGETMNFNPSAFTITSGVLMYEDSIETVTLTSAGAVATAGGGTYPIVPSAAVGSIGTDLSNYNITYVNGTLTVNKIPLTVKAKDTSKVYGDANPVLVATYTGFVNNETFATSGITGSPALSTTATTGSVVGTYPITVANGTLSSSKYSFSFVPGILTVTKAPLTVKADDKVIFQGDVLNMNSLTSTITGLKNGDNATVPSYTISPAYTGDPGVYSIIPGALTFSRAGSYSITYINGTLYVNPKGNSAKKLRPQLDCVEEVPGAPADRRFIAHFSCINDNATPVYVPIGPDNNMTSATGLFDASQLPVLFMPGTTKFDIPFDGSKLTWELKTYETNKKTSVATNASSTSSRCPTVTMRTSVPDEDPATVTATESRAYPNPARNRITLETINELGSNRQVVFVDADGRIFPARIIRTVSAHALELDVSGLRRGVYLVRLNVKGGLETIRFIKL